ncbi:hypothetical protein MKW98_004872 [Papaver atlanticum]|uniref:Uncharacterized protein n=1 Tax=Papaver atlanticum TaxID=357466 RepID=A0AAD4X415_9MAGN|nr:hypothetical protein MKW98_004872 [Papaver atlanticum]
MDLKFSFGDCGNPIMYVEFATYSVDRDWSTSSKTKDYDRQWLLKEMRRRRGGFVGGSTCKDPMYHSLADKDQFSPRQSLGFKGSSEDQVLVKKKRKSQVEKGPPVQVYSQEAYNVPAPKHKERRKQVDLTPTSSLPGPRSTGNSQRSSPILPTADNNHRREDLSRASSLPNLNGGSNVPHELNDDSGTSMPRRFVKRGITRMLKAMGRLPVKKLLPVVLVVGEKFVGENAFELILSLGVWSRQRENFPLSIRLFRDMPQGNIERVSQKARDHYTLEPDDEFAEKALRKHMNIQPIRITAHLNSRSQRASDARKRQALNHTNGTESFARKIFERRVKGLAIDPLTMFNETHKDENQKLPPICAEWKKEMNDLLEKKQRGEIDCSLEEIYNRVVDSSRLGRKRRRKQAALPTYYSRTDEQLSAVKEQLDAANRKIERMKKSGSNFIKLMNVALKNLGQAPLPENALDPNEDNETEDERHQVEDEDGEEETEEEETEDEEENMEDGQYENNEAEEDEEYM